MAIIKVKTGGITADAVTATEIADNAVVTAAINADAVTDAKIADDVVGTEHLTANEVDTAALAADAVTAAQIADDAISEEHLDVTAITGHTAETSVADGDLVVVHDASASALRKMTVANLVANAGGGKILQVVQAIKTARVQTTSTTAATTGLSVAITPSATNSKIMLLSTIGSGGNSGINNRTFFAFNGGNTSTFLGDAATGHECVAAFTTDRSDYGQNAANMMYVDSPSTTSEVTYSVYFWGDTGTTTMGSAHSVTAEGGNTASSIIAIEIGA